MARSASQPARRRGAARHEGFLRHDGFLWLKLALLLGLMVAAGFAHEAMQPDFRLRHLGGSWFGYTTGTLGALLILWLTCLGLRKRRFTDGAWSLKAWVSAHVYLGLSLIVIATLHSGFQFGWNIHTLAYGLMMLVILSGLCGVILYVRLPRRLSENRGELTQEQMLEIIHSLDSRLKDAAQPLGQEAAALVRASVENTDLGGNAWQRLTGRHPNDPTAIALRTLTARKTAAEAGGPLEPVIGLLGQKQAVLEKARRHIRLRSLLEAWLFVHVPATFALIAALTAHIVSVFFYW